MSSSKRQKVSEVGKEEKDLLPWQEDRQCIHCGGKWDASDHKCCFRELVMDLYGAWGDLSAASARLGKILDKVEAIEYDNLFQMYGDLKEVVFRLECVPDGLDNHTVEGLKMLAEKEDLKNVCGSCRCHK